MTNRICWLVTLLLAGFLAASGAVAGTPGQLGSNSLAVHVKMPSGKDLPSLVHLELTREDMIGSPSGPSQEAYCDSEGHYSFRGLPDGNYRLSVSVGGYLPRRYDVYLTNGSVENVTVQLPRPASKSGNDGTVSVQYLAVPEKARKKFERAQEHAGHSDFDGAAKQLLEAIAIDPSFVAAHNQLGLAYLRLQKPDLARESFETAVRTDARFLPARLNLADMAMSQKDYRRAADLLAEASKYNPNRAEPYFLMGKLLLELNDLTRAEEACKQALERDYGKLPEIHLVLSNVYLRGQQIAKAKEEMQAYLKLAPEGPYAATVRDHLSKLEEQEAARHAYLPSSK